MYQVTHLDPPPTPIISPKDCQLVLSPLLNNTVYTVRPAGAALVALVDGGPNLGKNNKILTISCNPSTHFYSQLRKLGVGKVKITRTTRAALSLVLDI